MTRLSNIREQMVHGALMVLADFTHRGQPGSVSVEKALFDVYGEVLLEEQADARRYQIDRQHPVPSHDRYSELR